MGGSVSLSSLLFGPRHPSKRAFQVNNLPDNGGDKRDAGLTLGSGRYPGGEHGNPLQYSCLGNPHGQRSLAGYSPWGHKELHTTEATEHARTHAHIHLEVELLGHIDSMFNFLRKR